MKIVFGSAELARRCNRDDERRRAYGAQLSSTLRRRLGEIAAANHLGELRSVPAAQLRADTTDADGWLLVALGQAADLRVRPNHNPLPTLLDGRLDEGAVRDLLVGAVNLAR